MAEKKSKLVVIVDDDEDLLKLLTYSFETQDYKVKGIKNGAEALDYFSKEENCKSTALLILDRLLPDLDGIEILKAIEQHETAPPVLILSVLSSEKDVLVGLRSGAIDYITKPFNIQILMGKAEMLISRYRG